MIARAEVRTMSVKSAAGERRVERFGSDGRRECLESRRRHEFDGAEAPDVTKAKRAPVGERELDAGIVVAAALEGPGFHQQRAGEARRDDETIARGEIRHDILGATPEPVERRALDALCESRRRTAAQHVRPMHARRARSSRRAPRMSRSRAMVSTSGSSGTCRLPREVAPADVATVLPAGELHARRRAMRSAAARRRASARVPSRRARGRRPSRARRRRFAWCRRERR